MNENKEIIIRIFQERDALQVSRVIKETLLTTNSRDYPMSILQPLHDYFTPDKVAILASERYCVVAQYANTIVGTGAIEEEELKTIFVLPNYQGLGIGKEIVKALEVFARKKEVPILKVPASISGIGFYEKLGYQKGETFVSIHAGQQTWMTKELQSTQQ